MELLLEIIFELLLEGGAEVVRNKRVSKWIRIPAAVLLSLLVIAVIITIFFVGVMFLTDDGALKKALGVLFVALGALFTISAIRKIIKIKRGESGD